MADRELEVCFLLPDGEQESVQLCVSATGADLVDEVLSLCGLGLTDRNRRRVVLANQETGGLVHACGPLGEVEWGDVATVESAELAETWSQQVGVGFAHARDPAPGGSAGEVYSEAFRFRRSVAGVWSSASLGFYAEQKAAGRELESSHGQDVNQLAGDMVVGSDGRMLMAYYSKDNTDRPSVDALLAAVARDPAAQSVAAPDTGETADWVQSLPEAPADDVALPAAAPAAAKPLPVAVTPTSTRRGASIPAAQPASSPADPTETERVVSPARGTAGGGPALAAWAAAGAFVGTILALAVNRVVFGGRPAE